MTTRNKAARLVAWTATALSATLLLAACGSSNGSGTAASPSGTSHLGGTVMGGRQPVIGASVIVYAAGLTSSDAPQQIGSATTDSTGSWGVDTFSPAPANGQLIYVMASGGQPTAGITNTQSVLLDVAGLWGSASFPGSINVNELTTVAATSVYQSTLTDVACSTISGNTQSSGNCPSITGGTGSGTLAALAGLVDVSAGKASTALTAAASGTVRNTTLTKLNFLASLLANCVNSAGGAVGDGSSCGNLFAAAANNVPTPGSSPLSSVSAGIPQSVAASPDGKWVFTQNDEDSTLVSFSVGNNGALTQVSSITVDGGFTYTVSPDSKYLYADATNSKKTIVTYAINSDGSLTQASSFADSNGPIGLAASPDGAYLYVAEGGNIVTDSVSSGALSASSTVADGDTNAPRGMAVTPDGLHLVISHLNDISVYSIASGGVVTGTPVSTVPDSNTPMGVSITPDGHYVFVSDRSQGVSLYSLASNGTLAYISSLSDNHGPFGVAVSPDGQYLYVCAENSEILQTYALGAAADTLQAAINIANSSNSNLGSTLFAQAPTPVVYSPIVTSAPANWTISGKHYALVADSNGVETYTLGTDGSLSASPVSNYHISATPRALTVTPNGQIAFAVLSATKASALEIDPGTGALTLLNSTCSVAGPQFLTVSPDGQYLYNTRNVLGSGLFSNQINADGSCTSINNIAPGGTTFGIATSPDGSLLYSVIGSTSINAYPLSSGTIGSTASATTNLGGDSLIDLSVTPNGMLFTIDTSNNTINSYSTDSSGNLTALTTNTTESIPGRITTSRDGQFLFETDSTDSIIVTYTIGSSGTLTLASSISNSNSPLSISVTP